uniref:G_PROTEIN_RECEP_F1_2 domain-containing protein n=1 Tax=Strongyloides papillosus TaxID=174720 RepID=A0A0N5BCI1_STREA
MNISKEWNDILGNYGYHLQHLQLFTSPVAISISVFAFSLFYKRNVYHDNFRIVIQALTISLLSNNMMIFSHSYTSFKDDSFNFDLIDDIEKMKPLKGNLHICDKYSPIPLPLMFINVSMLFVLIIERNVAIYTFGKYEKLQFGNTIYYFCIPLWLFSLLLIVYDFFAIVGIDGNFLFKFCHSVFVQKFYWKFSLPYVAALPPLVLITFIFIKNYKVSNCIKNIINVI